MHDTHAAQMWHLSRGKQQRVLVTDQELRLLAQQGDCTPRICFGDADLMAGEQLFLFPDCSLRLPCQNPLGFR